LLPARIQSLRWFIPGLLLLFLAATPLFTGVVEFTGDDHYYVANNPLVTSPELSALAEIWRRPMKIEYFPVTITSYAIEYRLFGGEVKGYHLTNLLLFICIGLAARSLAIRLNQDPEQPEDSSAILHLAGGATLLCLAHPLNVESIASISNRKELLYVLFGLLSLNSHLTRGRTPATLIATGILMVLAQLSKGSAVILPMLLLFADLVRGTAPSIRRSLRPAALYAAVAAGIFIIQFRVALTAGVVDKSGSHGVFERIGGVFRAVNAMLVKFLYPVNLAYDYDLPWPDGIPLAESLLPALLLLLLLWLVLRERWQLLALCLLPLVAILPYSNIVPLRHNMAGRMVFYDHYLLFAIVLCAPLLTRMLLGFSDLWRRRALIIMLLLTVGLAACDFRIYGFWQSRESLYRRIIAVSPGLPKGYLFLGKSYLEQGRHAEAIGVLRTIFTLEDWYPTYLEAYRELGNAYAYSGRYAEAEQEYRLHLQHLPRDRGSLQNLSATLIMQEKYGEAREIILQWIGYYPEDQDARYNLQVCDERLGRGR